MTQARTILFVCTGNTCRSYMAEVIAKDFLDRLGQDAAGIKVISAGTGAMADEPASPAAVQAMQELGLKLPQHKARALTPELLAQADLVFVMTARHKQQVLALSPESAGKVYLLTEYGADTATPMDILDPFGRSLEYYRTCAAQLQKHVRQAINKMLKQAGK